MMQRGFTLIELLVVIVLFGTIGSVIGSILFSAFRGSSKSALLTTVSQNGSYAITQMSKMIRSGQWNAGNGDGVSVDDSSGSYTTNCFTPSPTPTLQYHYLKITSTTDGLQTKFICDTINNPSNPIASTSGSTWSNISSLVDTSTVKVNTCSFTCSQTSATDIPLITIDFTLQQAGSSSFAEKIVSPIDFNTSVELSNISR